MGNSIKITHVGLVKFDEKNGLTKVAYFKSKFEKNLGDVMTHEGDKMNVGVIADDRENVIIGLNRLISMQNKITRMKNKRADKEFWSQAMAKVNTYVNEEI